MPTKSTKAESAAYSKAASDIGSAYAKSMNDMTSSYAKAGSAAVKPTAPTAKTAKATSSSYTLGMSTSGNSTSLSSSLSSSAPPSMSAPSTSSSSSSTSTYDQVVDYFFPKPKGKAASTKPSLPSVPIPEMPTSVPTEAAKPPTDSTGFSVLMALVLIPFIAFYILLQYDHVHHAGFKMAEDTGLEFPMVMTSTAASNFALGDTKMVLVGVGTRYRLGFLPFKVYSAGFYMTNKDIEIVRKSDNVYKAIDTTIKGPMMMSISFASAKPGVAKLARTLSALPSGAKSTELEEMLVSGIPEAGLKRGETIEFDWSVDGTLSLRVDGVFTGHSITDTAIVDGLKEVFFGTKPISPTLKADVGAYFA